MRRDENGNRKPVLDVGQWIQIILIVAGGLVFYFGSLRGIDQKLSAIDVKLENHSVRIGNVEKHVAEDRVLKPSDAHFERRNP